ncbi:hypothetical protein SUDANB105_00752 [Streptomyces sp. enrichment culture]|uniref:relaxase/mobilization nuclease n=1 Tax=Streptomyces sp. enrichment culture TaxID=1795815 RepID=UPI003F56566F
MIPRVSERTHTPHGPLGEALGRPVTPEEGLTEHKVIAHWPGLDAYTLDGEQAEWTPLQWAEHLEDPLLAHPFTAGPGGDRRAVFHLDARLHPDDRDLSVAEWAEVAHRLARAAGVETPGDEDGCSWIAVQGQPGRLDLIANLIRLDGTWQQQPSNPLRRISDEARRIEQDLRLIPVSAGPRQSAVAQPVPAASTQLAAVLAQLANEHSGPLAAARGLVEHAAHRIDRRPGSASPSAARGLELIALRLHGIQHDLTAAATDLNAGLRPPVVAASAAARHTTRRTL